ncbi:adenine phosphoribosyltransferase [Babesia caballi]|uniref:adenine phosphoribosyltransferase n=1 Tax=Babesia caballi TaxID=5871 RepID=A0AAV4M6F9_BABCB|nr:adenine phosphoribosyltransferase [Babesia caballi]
MVAQAFQLTEEDFRIFTDFKPGIRFVDIMPVLKDDYKFRETIKVMAEGIRQRHPEGVDYIAALELRGVPFAAPLAYELCCGLVIIRKPGKLLADAVEDGARVVIVDDLLALGGTLSAACRLLRELKAKILSASLSLRSPVPLAGNIQKAFPEVPVNSVMNFYLPPRTLKRLQLNEVSLDTKCGNKLPASVV